MSTFTDEYIDQLQEAVSRRYAERTTDSLPLKTTPDFRLKPGLKLDTYGWLAGPDDLDDDPYKAAEGIVEAIIDLEATLVKANPTATHRVRLAMGNPGPVIFRKAKPGTADAYEKWLASDDPDAQDADRDVDRMRREEDMIKIRHDIGVQIPEGEPVLPEGASYVGDRGEYDIVPPNVRQTTEAASGTAG